MILGDDEFYLGEIIFRSFLKDGVCFFYNFRKEDFVVFLRLVFYWGKRIFWLRYFFWCVRKSFNFGDKVCFFFSVLVLSLSGIVEIFSNIVYSYGRVFLKIVVSNFFYFCFWLLFFLLSDGVCFCCIG